jgi:poly(beta-D-mannuronate) lyase
MRNRVSVVLAAVGLLAGSVAGAQTYVEVTPPASGVTASTSDVNVAANTVDGNLTTRWSGNGDGATLQLDLGSTRTIGYVNVAVHSGNTRRNAFEVQVLVGSTWTTVWSGSSAGTTTGLETFDFTDVDARMIRYLGHGATLNAGGTSTWNSVSEIEVFAASGGGPAYEEVTPGSGGVTASTNDGNLPGNAVDGNLATRWSANGDGQWLRLDLGSTRPAATFDTWGTATASTRGTA